MLKDTNAATRRQWLASRRFRNVRAFGGDVLAGMLQALFVAVAFALAWVGFILIRSY